MTQLKSLPWRHDSNYRPSDFPGAIQEVAKASISEVIRKLKDSGEQHCLVVDRDSHEIRGIFSASDISRKLHLPIDIQDKSSFYKVFSATA